MVTIATKNPQEKPGTKAGKVWGLAIALAACALILGLMWNREKAALAITQAQLTSAGSELQQTKLDLAATQAELAATNTRMSSTRAELDAANVTIASTRAQLSTTKAPAPAPMPTPSVVIPTRNSNLATAQIAISPATSQEAIAMVRLSPKMSEEAAPFMRELDWTAEQKGNEWWVVGLFESAWGGQSLLLMPRSVMVKFMHIAPPAVRVGIG